MKFFNKTDTIYTYYVAIAFAKQTRCLAQDPARGSGYHKYTDSCNFMSVCVGEWLGMGGVKMEAWSESSPTLFKTLEQAKIMASCLSKSVFEFDLIPDTVHFYKVTRYSSVTFDIQEQP